MERVILDHLILSKNWKFKFIWKQTYLLCPLKRLNISKTSTHTSLYQWIDINENFLDLNVFPSQHAGPQSVTLLATFCFTLLMLYLKIKGPSCKEKWLKLKLTAGILIFYQRVRWRLLLLFTKIYLFTKQYLMKGKDNMN